MEFCLKLINFFFLNTSPGILNADLDKGAVQLSGWWKIGIMDRPPSLKIKKPAIKFLVKCTDMSTTAL